MSLEKMKALILETVHTGVELIYPKSTYCVCCGKYIDHLRSYCLCDHCIQHMGWGFLSIDTKTESKVQKREEILDSVSACMTYGLYERRLIFELKYNGHTYMAPILAKILYDRIINDPEAIFLTEVDFLIPVPIHKLREKKRGFNQAEKIGRHLIKFIRDERVVAPKMLTKALERKWATVPQRGLSAQERFENLEGIFCVPEAYKKLLQGKRILLLDDIYTSGATGYHCAKALKEAGAGQVHLLVVTTGNDFVRESQGSSCKSRIDLVE